MKHLRKAPAYVLALAAGAAVAAPAAMGADVLPDLRPEPVARYAFDGRSIEGRSLLRFTGAFSNRGGADAILIGNRPTGADPAMSVTQRIAQTDGTFSDRPTPAQMVFETDDGHGHWHTQRLVSYGIQRLDAQGVPQAPAGTSIKTGFCLRDDKVHLDLPVPPARRYVDNCGNPAATTLITGLQAGYTDVYEPEVANQWVDVTGLPAGRYRLSIAVDPDNFVRESDETNNVVTWDITLPMVTHSLARQRLTAKRVAIVANGRAKTVAYATLSHRSVVTGTVFKMRGTRATLVRDMKPRRYAHGAARISWNQRDNRGRLMGRGLYKIKLVARTKRGVSQPEYMTFAITRKSGR